MRISDWSSDVCSSDLNEKQLKAYLTMLEEAEKRDHRRLGREMDLFHLQEEAAGPVFWHPKGWTLYRTVEAYLPRRLDAAGHAELNPPHPIDRSPRDAFCHRDKFHDPILIAESQNRPPA